MRTSRTEMKGELNMKCIRRVLEYNFSPSLSSLVICFSGLSSSLHLQTWEPLLKSWTIRNWMDVEFVWLKIRVAMVEEDLVVDLAAHRVVVDHAQDVAQGELLKFLSFFHRIFGQCCKWKLINREMFQLDQDLVAHRVVVASRVALVASLQLRRKHREAVAAVRSLVEAAPRVLLRGNLAQDHVNAIRISHILEAVITAVAAKYQIETVAMTGLVLAVMDLINLKENQDHGKTDNCTRSMKRKTNFPSRFFPRV